MAYKGPSNKAKVKLKTKYKNDYRYKDYSHGISEGSQAGVKYNLRTNPKKTSHLSPIRRAMTPDSVKSARRNIRPENPTPDLPPGGSSDDSEEYGTFWSTMFVHRKPHTFQSLFGAYFKSSFHHPHAPG